MKHEVGSNLNTAEVRLEVIAGPACGLSNVFHSHQTWIVGRSPHAQLSLPDDKECSRFHSRFEINPPHCVVADLRSRNGTKVNGLRISDVTSLLDGDKVQIGRSVIQVTSRNRSVDSADPKSPHPEPARFDSTVIISRKPAIPGYDITHIVG
ncbi:MAG: FHA domain-containing protein, partial [Planctomycetaceae bacterium]|nr:FHA domain-containing protein [Planctomycetaceae bacterium]